MKKQQLKPFKVGPLDSCPECGATGNYQLLASKAAIVSRKLDAFLHANPAFDSFATGPCAELKAAIKDMNAVIGKTL